jgi:hypothetical protein
LGTSRRLRRSTTLRHGDRRPDLLSQALLRNVPVAKLRPFVIGDHPDGRAEPLDHTLTLVLVAERRRRGDVEGQLDPRGCLVRMLPAGPARRTERLDQLELRDPHGVGHDEAVI